MLFRVSYHNMTVYKGYSKIYRLSETDVLGHYYYLGVQVLSSGLGNIKSIFSAPIIHLQFSCLVVDVFGFMY